jgi:hypothetical protein
MRTHKTYPAVKSGYQLDKYGWFSILEPVEMENLLENPSFETGDVQPSSGTWWYTARYPGVGGMVLTTSTLVQRRGAYSLRVTIPNDNLAYAGFLLTPIGGFYTDGQAYTFSCDILGNFGHSYAIYSIRTSGIVDATTGIFKSKGHWQRKHISFTYLVADPQVGIYIVRRSPTRDDNYFYIDGAMLTEGTIVSTYFDGDTLPYGEDGNYYWVGEPHDSRSARKGGELSTGIAHNLKDYDFDLLSYLGLGLLPHDNALTTNAMSGGATFRRGIDTTREYTLLGAIANRKFSDGMKNRAAINELINNGKILQQPIAVYAQLIGDNGEEFTEPLILPSLYQGGMESNVDNLYQERVALQFLMLKPQLLVDGEEGDLLDTIDTLALGYIARRTQNGWDVWSAQANQNNYANRFLFDSHTGRIYAGGAFTLVGGVACNHLAYYDIAADTWAAFGTFNASVYAIAIAPNNDIFVGGGFTTAGNDYVAFYDDSVPGWDTSIVVPGPVYDIDIADDGITVYICGEDISTGEGYVYSYNIRDGTTTDLLGGTPATGQVNKIAIDRNGNVYVTGQFGSLGGTLANNIAYYDGTTWYAMGSNAPGGGLFGTPGLGQNIIFADDGNIYVCGDFYSAGGVDCANIAGWNGTTFFALGDGLAAALPATPCDNMRFRDGKLYVGLMGIGVIGLPTAYSIGMWNGTNWLNLDINTGAAGPVVTLEFDNAGNLYIGHGLFDYAYVSGVAEPVNNGSAISYPVISLKCNTVVVLPHTWEDKLTWIRNETTNRTIYIDVDIHIGQGEIITLDLRPNKKRVISNIRGDITHMVIPGSDLASFYMAPGENIITAFVNYLSLPTRVYWQIAHDSIDGAVYG